MLLNTFQDLLDKLESWGHDALMNIPNLIIAILVIVGVFMISGKAQKLFLKILNRFSDKKTVNLFLGKIFTAVLIVLGLILALDILNLNKAVTSLLAGAGVAGLAISLAFQDPILNTLSGIMMSFRKPFNIGDLVKTNGYQGTIKKITMRSTQIKTLTGEDVFLPNKKVIQNPMVNYTLTQFRRIDLECGVHYDSDLDKVQRITLNCLNKLEGRDLDRDLEFYYTEFGPSSINFKVFIWLDVSEEPNYLVNRSQAIILLKKEFDKEGITIPFPIRTLEFPSEMENQLSKVS